MTIYDILLYPDVKEIVTGYRSSFSKYKTYGPSGIPRCIGTIEADSPQNAIYKARKITRKMGVKNFSRKTRVMKVYYQNCWNEQTRNFEKRRMN